MAGTSSKHGWAISDDESDSDDASLLPAAPQSRKKDSKFSIPSRIKEKQESARKTPVKVCPYGSRCYRKNSDHFEQFSHSKNTKSDDSEEDLFEISAKRQKLTEESRDPRDIWHASSPLNYLLTTVSGIPDKFNYLNSSNPICSLDIRDILSKNFGDLIETVQFNYCIDVHWFLEQLPSGKRRIPILFVHGEHGADYSEIDHEKYSNIKTCKVDLPPFGTHHTKMMFLRYENGIRIIIHTANLVKRDWYQKTQGLWISPLFLQQEDSKAEEKKTFLFKNDLLEYLNSYRKHPELVKWINLIKNHDLSTAKVVLVGSVPGRHRDSSLHKWGHLKLSRALAAYVDSQSVTRWPVIGQFSSIGSLGADKNKWLCDEFLKSLYTSNTKGIFGRQQGDAILKLIFPTVENVRKSLEGYPAGASLPYSYSVAKKQVWFNNFLHQWKAEQIGRTKASPHIKTYTRISKDCSQVAWFLLTSANMSKAAWGGLEKKGSQLAIKSYELGVLFLPQRFFAGSDKSLFNLIDIVDSKADLVLPYSTPLVPYSEDDEPWIWDIPHKHLPDRHGNMWVPS